MTSDIAIRRKRLLYQAQHRGFKEADLIIGNFAASEIDAMGDAELDEFEALLAYSDHDLYRWVIGEGEPPKGVAGPVFRRLRSFDVSNFTAPRD